MFPCHVPKPPVGRPYTSQFWLLLTRMIDEQGEVTAPDYVFQSARIPANPRDAALPLHSGFDEPFAPRRPFSEEAEKFFRGLSATPAALCEIYDLVRETTAHFPTDVLVMVALGEAINRLIENETVEHIENALQILTEVETLTFSPVARPMVERELTACYSHLILALSYASAERSS